MQLGICFCILSGEPTCDLCYIRKHYHNNYKQLLNLHGQQSVEIISFCLVACSNSYYPEVNVFVLHQTISVQHVLSNDTGFSTKLPLYS